MNHSIKYVSIYIYIYPVNIEFNIALVPDVISSTHPPWFRLGGGQYEPGKGLEWLVIINHYQP